MQLDRFKGVLSNSLFSISSECGGKYNSLRGTDSEFVYLLSVVVTCRLRKVQDVDASLLSIHPACVVSVSLSHLKTESVRQRKVRNTNTAKETYN